MNQPNDDGVVGCGVLVNVTDGQWMSAAPGLTLDMTLEVLSPGLETLTEYPPDSINAATLSAPNRLILDCTSALRTDTE